MTIVNVEDVFSLRDEIHRLNQIPLEEIEFYFDGQKVDIAEDVVKQFKYTGLSNDLFICDFLELPDR